jgi:hypothetical protein
MTEDSLIEERVRQTLRSVAARPIPPAPPVFDPRRRSVPRRPLRPVGVGVILAVIVGVLIIALVYGPHGGQGNKPRPVPTPATRVADPANFAVVSDSGDLKVDSAATGQVVKNLGTIAGYTNSGIALSPDGRYVYMTVSGNAYESIIIKQISVASSQATTIAQGVEPSISPNGRFLAFATFGTGSAPYQELVIRDLKSGSDRSIDLGNVLGGQGTLLNGSITWLGNGSQIAVVPSFVGTAFVGGATTTTTRPLSGSCSTVSISSTCLIVVGAKTGSPLTAERVIIHDLRWSEFVVGSSGPSGLVMAKPARGTVLYRVDVTHGAAKLSRLFSLDSAFSVAFDRSGAKLFYLKGHSLWLGEVAQHGIENAKELKSSVALGSLAW